MTAEARRTVEEMRRDACSRERTESHWDQTHVLAPGDRYLTWFLTFRHAPALLRRAALVRGAAPLTFLDWLAPDELHLTLQGVGREGELDPGVVAEVVAAATGRLRDVPNVRLHLALLAPGTQGVVLLPTDFEPLRRLRGALWHSITEVMGADAAPGGPELDTFPHVSLAYCNSVAPMTRLCERLKPLYEVCAREPDRHVVHSVDLVVLRREERSGRRCYRFDTRAVVPLNGAPDPGLG